MSRNIVAIAVISAIAAVVIAWLDLGPYRYLNPGLRVHRITGITQELRPITQGSDTLKWTSLPQ